jgi:hypothetical protein
MLPPLLLLLLFVFPARASTVCDWRENSTNASICDGSFHGTKVVLSWGGYGLGEFPVNELGLSWAGTGKEADAPPIEGTLPTELGLLKHLEVLCASAPCPARRGGPPWRARLHLFLSRPRSLVAGI